MTCIKMGLVNAIVDAKSPQTAEELAKTTGADRLLIGMRISLHISEMRSLMVQSPSPTPTTLYRHL